MELTQQLLDIPIEHMSNVFGKFDAWLKQIEKYLQVTMVVRDGSLKIMGEDKNVEAAQKVLTELLAMSQRGNDITEQTVTYALEERIHCWRQTVKLSVILCRENR